MGSTTTNQTSQTTAPTSAAVQATTDTLASKLGGLANQTAPYFDQSLYTGVGGNTQAGWAKALTAANDPNIGAATQNFGDVAAGKMFGTNDPGYAALRQKAIDDTLSSVGSQFTNSGRFGGDSYLRAASEGVGNAVAGLDYQNYQSDIARQQAAVPLFQQLSQYPSSIYGAVGAAQDADAQAQRQGAYDLYTRQTEAPLQWLQGITSAANGNAATSGQTTTSSTQVPWWQVGLGAAATGAGIAGSLMRPY